MRSLFLSCLLALVAACRAAPSPPASADAVAASASAEPQSQADADAIAPATNDDDGLAAAPAALVGDYHLTGIHDGAAVCSAHLTADSAIGGWGLELEPACIEKLGAPEDAEVWSVDADGQLLFLDATRRVLRRFRANADGDHVSLAAADGGEDKGEHSLFLQRADP